MKYSTRPVVASFVAAAALALAVAGCGDSTSATKSTSPMMSTTTAATAGQVDQAFVRQMIPHHQMAVEMGELAAKHAHRQEVKTLAAAIVTAQQAEIAELKTIRNDLGATGSSPSAMGADAGALGLTMDQMGMSMDMQNLAQAGDFDRAFVVGMIPHHQGAIAMAQAELDHGSDPRLQKLATGIIAAQTKEIALMRTWQKAWGADQPAATDDQSGTPGMDRDEMPGMN